MRDDGGAPSRARRRSRQPDAVHAELGQVAAGQKPGRTSREEIVVFDSTGVALQDVAAAALVYEKAVSTGRGLVLGLADG
jgi:alanine dehydrogenase